MKNIVFLCSGGGGNLRFIDRCIRLGILPGFHLCAVITDRNCGSLEYAESAGIKSFQIAYNKSHRNTLKELLTDIAPDLIVTNIHKILDEDLVLSFEHKLINLHYSLLPAFPGLIGIAPIQKAVNGGCRFLGTTVHFVEEEVDMGKIISQSIFSTPEDNTFDQIVDKTFRSGCLNLLNAILLLSGRRPLQTIPPHGEGFIFSPTLTFDPAHFTEDFWQSIK